MICLATSTLRGDHSARPSSAHLTQTTFSAFAIKTADRASQSQALFATRSAQVALETMGFFAERRSGTVVAQVACQIGEFPA